MFTLILKLIRFDITLCQFTQLSLASFGKPTESEFSLKSKVKHADLNKRNPPCDQVRHYYKNLRARTYIF